MAYKLSCKIKNDFIEYHVSGEREMGMEASAARQMAMDLNKLSERCGLYKVLFITKQSGDFPKLDLFGLMEELHFHSLVGHLKIAIVNLNEEVHSDLSFIETIAVQHGFDFKVFINKNRGKRWLLKKENRINAVLMFLKSLFSRWSLVLFNKYWGLKNNHKLL